MKRRFGVLLFAMILLPWNGLVSPAQDTPTNPESGVAYTIQATSSQMLPKTFGATWDSVRTFPLMQALDQPLRVYVETHPNDTKLYKAKYVDFVSEGLKMWSDALDRRLRYELTQDPQNADITLNWVGGFSEKGVAGLAVYSVGHSKIQIKTVGIPEMDIKANIIHEIGHALGIAGHSGNKNDIMIGIRRWSKPNSGYNPRLSKQDIQAIRRLYGPAWQKGEDLFSASSS